MLTLRQKLNHAVTEYDRKQEARAKRSKRGYYNAYALAQYLGRVDKSCAAIDRGADTRQTLESNFCGPLLTCVLKAAGLGAASLDANYLSAAKARELFN